MNRAAVLIVAVAVTSGCTAKAQTSDEFRQSEGEVIKLPAELDKEERLCLRTFVQLKSGALVLPRLYYLQKHFTSVGVRDVEKVGTMSWVVAPYRQFIYLPTSGEIDKYVFLACRPVVTGGITEYSDCALMIVAADEVQQAKALRVPTFDELQETREDNRVLFDKIASMYADARAKSEAAGKRPITKDTEVPWWAQ
jgi:hypothetical protein